jgi:hypothetical protein
MADSEINRGADISPAPWSGKVEAAPIGDTGDDDMPFVIRDAGGHIVLTIWEQYGPGLTPIHEIVGQRIVDAVNAGERPPRAAAVDPYLQTR